MTDSWIVAIKPTSEPALVDLYFNFWRTNGSYKLDMTFANGTSQTVQTQAGKAPNAPATITIH